MDKERVNKIITDYLTERAKWLKNEWSVPSHARKHYEKCVDTAFELSAEPKLPEELKTKDWSKNAIIAKIDELIIWAKSVEERLTKKEE